MIENTGFLERIRVFSAGVFNKYLTEEVLLVAIMILTASASFGLGRLSALETQKIPVQFINVPTNVANVTASANTANSNINNANVADTISPTIQSQGVVVASKNSDKYHYPWCGGAQRISEKNKVWYASIEDARASGLVPASNCKGLE